MNGRELESFCISQRRTAKARAPLATPARNALKKAKAKLVKLYGGDSMMVFAYNLAGEPIQDEWQALQRGEAVTLRMIHEVRPSADFFDPGGHKVMGELTVSLV